VAGLNSSVARGQFAAIAQVRWQLFINSLRTMRGRLEMVSRVLIGFGFTMGGLGGAVGLAAASWYFTSHDQTEWLALLLWVIFLFWQLFPVMATAFTETFDSSNLLRFPLSYPSFFVVRLVYGSLDPATALGSLWLFGIWMGVTAADRRLFVPGGLALFVFALANILLARMVFAWVERWLAQRRTREIMGILFFFLIISFQFIGPLMARFGGKKHPDVTRLSWFLLPLERLLPPGLTASALAHFSQADFAAGFASFGLLCVYTIAFFWFLNVRMLAQYRGENLSEAAAAAAPRKLAKAGSKEKLREGWNVPGVSGPVAAIFEKEFRYLSRSGPMLFTLVMPLVILLIFRLSPGRSGGEGFFVRAPDFAFPVGAAYALLMLTNLIYNNFGADGAGVQFYFVSPVRFREIVRAKNLVHATILAFEMILIWTVVCFLYRPPSFYFTITTIAGVLLAAFANMAVGNLLSLYTPKKFDFGTFGRQRAANTTAFASLGVQAVVLGIGALAFLLARLLHKPWLATVLLLVLAAIAFVCYAIVLKRVNGIALDRRETLISELSRA
jgi:ABC-2 type transport system permease protein